MTLLAHSLLAAFQLAATAAPPPPVIQPAYSGRANQLTVPIPRIEADVTVDGSLDEPAWEHAARLTGFSQYSPMDGVPASDSTDVLVWYSPTAIHFGIRAYEAHGAATASLANRDRIFGDDNVQIIIDTFHDGKRALMFAVNPLGVQADGTLTEGTNTAAGGFIGSAVIGREQADLNPDFVYQSRGRVTPWGYEVEVRIPFKSLRYQRGRVQNWGLNVVRQVKHSGFEDSWAPARLTAPSFLGQSGQITGIEGIRHALVLDLNPEATRRQDGAIDTSGAFVRDWGPVELGGNLRLGLGSSFGLAATLHPDFSQVESDAGQLSFDPRQALFYPEKRPFFLEGSELFSVPNNLIYTRRIVQPDAAVKLTGNVNGLSIGFLSAVDRQEASYSGHDNPVFTIMRAQRAFGSASRLGVAFTDREDGNTANRVADVDGRLVLGRVTTVNFQLAGSATSQGGATSTGPLWATNIRVQGRNLGMTGVFSGVSDKFHTTSGFIGRNGIVHSYVDPSYTVYGKTGALIERFIGDIVVDGIWQYPKFFNGLHVQDRKLHFNGNFFLRSGWSLGAGYFVESFGYDSALYAPYRIEVPKSGGGLDTIPFTGQPTIINGEYIVQGGTPQWRHFSASGYWLQGHDENFPEWASGDLKLLSLDVIWRPTDRMRAELGYFWQQVNRRTDGSLITVGRIPRLQVEYQVARPLFVRLVGQYVQTFTDSLRDDSRTNAPILLATPGGIVRSAVQRSNVFHTDVLISYQPVPGTTILAGYATNANDPEQFRFQRLLQTDDVLFVKLTWLFRM